MKGSFVTSTKGTHRTFVTALLGGAMLLAACTARAPSQPAATEPPPPPTAAPTAEPTVAPTEAPTVAPTVEPTTAPTAAPQGATGPATVKVATTSLGPILVADNGMTLYLFTKDANGESACYDQCATNWPPLLTNGAPQAGEGADAGLLGTTTRKDGSMQVTYNKLPLYFFAKDKAAGDTTGQNVGDVWYVVSPKGEEVESAPAAAGAKVAVGKTSLGDILVGDKDMSLYMFTKDTKDVSNCYDQCATNWPPLLTEGAPAAGDGVTASMLGTTTRKDGKMQVTFNGMPLYYFAKDKAAGDTTGQEVGDVWYVVSPKGDAIGHGEKPAAAAGAKVAVGKTSLGDILVGDKDMSLYMFTKDTKDVSNCYDQCATNWPPLLTEGAPAAGDGVTASMLGTTTRKDGKMQVTFNGMPLYYFAKDKAAGDTTGQEVGDVWYVVSPKGDAIGHEEKPAAAAGASVAVAKTSLGDILVGADGRTLYMFTKDANGESACYDQCATNWPPLLTEGAPAAGDGVTASMLGTTTRKDGKMQVTYNKMPLYYFAKDKAAGDVAGQKVGDVWFVLNAAGEVMK